MKKKIVIEHCNECPSYDDYPDTCMKLGKQIPNQYGVGYELIPEWCPLPDEGVK
jgi:hypothetical protein